MSAILTKFEIDAINQEIHSHPAWYGLISGMTADKMLRNYKTPYLYILREGELKSDNQTDYYVSYVSPDLTVRHQPFVITISSDGWYYENSGAGGPYASESIEDVLYLMMHCEKGDPIPLKQLYVR